MVKIEFGVKHFKIDMELFELLACYRFAWKNSKVIVQTFEGGIFLNLDNTLGV